jgi:hypothetical protein
MNARVSGCCFVRGSVEMNSNVFGYSDAGAAREPRVSQTLRAPMDVTAPTTTYEVPAATWLVVLSGPGHWRRWRGQQMPCYPEVHHYQFQA